MHVEHLLVDNQKMSKSLGNTHTIPDVVAQGYRPSAVRYLLLSAHYRKQLNFTWEGLAQAEASLGRLVDCLARAERVTRRRRSNPDVAARVAEARQEFARGDACRSQHLGRAWRDVRPGAGAQLGHRCRSDSDAAICPAVRDAFDEFDKVLGILSLRRAEDDQPPVPVAEIEQLIEERHAARRRRDFAAADRIRDDLAARGILLEDSAGGTRWKRK